MLSCVQFILIAEAHLPFWAANAAQRSRRKHSKNLNYEALKIRKTVIGKKNSFMLAGTEKHTNVTP